MIGPQIIAAYPFLGKLSARSKHLIGMHGRIRVLRRGAAVIRKGDRVGGMYFVIAGRLRVFTISPGGEEASLYVVDRGESCLLATSALFADMLYPAWVEVAAKETRLFVIPSEVFRTLFEAERTVRDFTVNILSRRVFDLMILLEETALFSLEDRLKNFLVRSVNESHELEITHEKIAASLGTSREVVSRKLQQLSQAGLIETSRGSVRLLKPDAMGASRQSQGLNRPGS